jgi:hypothetical protein
LLLSLAIVLSCRDLAQAAQRKRKQAAAATAAARAKASVAPSTAAAAARKAKHTATATATGTDHDSSTVQFAPSRTANGAVSVPLDSSAAATGLSVDAGANAAVTVAGAEPLGASITTTATTAAITTAATATTGGVNSTTGDTKGWCSATEARLLAEAGSSGAARALLLIQMARFRCSSDSNTEANTYCNDSSDAAAAAAAAAEQLLKQAAAALADTEARESALLNEAETRLSDVTADVSTLSLLTSPPAPAVLSRGATWIVVQLPPFKLRVAHLHTSSTTASSSNSTRQHGTAAVAAVHCVKVYAKPGGTGVAVSTNSSGIAGTGVPVCYDASTGSSSAVRVRGLVPCTSYVFAAAAYDAAGNQVSISRHCLHCIS